MNDILLGVDGGNTKTDFFLFDTQGACLAHLRTGTCSHEALHGYGPAEEALAAGLREVSFRAGLEPGRISSAVLGLAGVDIPSQYREMGRIVSEYLPKALVCNDSLLGVKAAAPDGVGLCCINGTGASVSGVDDTGRFYQAGGCGNITSDFAGGGFASVKVLQRVYDQCCRDGRETVLTPRVYRLLGLEEGADLLEAFHPTNLSVKEYEKELNLLLFRSAREGDAVARDILDDIAVTMAATTAGCAGHLVFHSKLSVVMAGSLWVKGDYPPMVERYQEEVCRRLRRPVDFILLQEPPALGAVYWAWQELAGGMPPWRVRDKIAAEMRRMVEEEAAVQ